VKRANIAELKNGFSKYLEEVKRGVQVLVSDRNVPFAKIVPLDQTDDYEAEGLELILKAAGNYGTAVFCHKGQRPLIDNAALAVDSVTSFL
jgi:prevent-host-death family protein